MGSERVFVFERQILKEMVLYLRDLRERERKRVFFFFFTSNTVSSENQINIKAMQSKINNNIENQTQHTIASPQRLDDSSENPLREIIVAFLQWNLLSLRNLICLNIL